MKPLITILTTLLIVSGIYFYSTSPKTAIKPYDYQGQYFLVEKSDQVDGLPKMQYRLGIDSNTGKWNGSLTLSDGKKDIEMNVIPGSSTIDDSMDIKFDSYKNGSTGLLKKDDLLFNVKGGSKRLFVTWKVLRPVDDRNLNGVYFEKTDSIEIGG